MKWTACYLGVREEGVLYLAGLLHVHVPHVRPSDLGGSAVYSCEV